MGKLAPLSEDFHAFVVEIMVDESLACSGTRRFVA
jgi:hypothetical protein